MDLRIYTRHLKLTEGIEEYINQKSNRLEKYLDPESQVKVKISCKDDKKKVEITLTQENGSIIRAEELQDDLYSAIDIVYERIDNQVEKYIDSIKSENFYNKKLQVEYKYEENEEKYNSDSFFYKRKKFYVKPMSLEEAILQMELLGHNFYMFRNQDTYEINVTYKRRQGGYGLIEQE